MVIHGNDDLILPLDVGQHLHESLQDSEIHVIPESSHQVFQEEADAVAQLLLGFITKL